MAARLAAARVLAPKLEDALNAVPPYRSHLYGEADRDAAVAYQETRALALRRLVAIIEGWGGTVEARWDGAVVRIYGLRATSTSGTEGACRNWLAQLAKRWAAEALEGAK